MLFFFPKIHVPILTLYLSLIPRHRFNLGRDCDVPTPLTLSMLGIPEYN